MIFNDHEARKDSPGFGHPLADDPSWTNNPTDTVNKFLEVLRMGLTALAHTLSHLCNQQRGPVSVASFPTLK